MSDTQKSAVGKTAVNAPNEKGEPPKKSKRKTQVAQNKRWDACTLAGFGIGTEEYLRHK